MEIVKLVGIGIICALGTIVVACTIAYLMVVAMAFTINMINMTLTATGLM